MIQLICYSSNKFLGYANKFVTIPINLLNIQLISFRSNRLFYLIKYNLTGVKTTDRRNIKFVTVPRNLYTRYNFVAQLTKFTTSGDGIIF